MRRDADVATWFLDLTRPGLSRVQFEFSQVDLGSVCIAFPSRIPDSYSPFVQALPIIERQLRVVMHKISRLNEWQFEYEYEQVGRPSVIHDARDYICSVYYIYAIQTDNCATATCAINVFCTGQNLTAFRGQGKFLIECEICSVYCILQHFYYIQSLLNDEYENTNLYSNILWYWKKTLLYGIYS